MDDEALRLRLWRGFARLQALLGGHAKGGAVVNEDGLIASVVPHSPDSPALNAVVAVEPAKALARIEELEREFRRAGVRRGGAWVDGPGRGGAPPTPPGRVGGRGAPPGEGGA